MTLFGTIWPPKMEPEMLQNRSKRPPWAPKGPKGVPRVPKEPPRPPKVPSIAHPGAKHSIVMGFVGLHFGPFWFYFGPFGHIVIPSGVPPALIMRRTARYPEPDTP